MRIGSPLWKLVWGFRALGFLLPFISKQKIHQFVKDLRPWNCSVNLIRVGDSNDGGYLVPDDLSGITACFSPGVSDLADFEADLQKRFEIPSYLADYSVNGPPQDFVPAGFIKKFVGNRNDEQTITMKSWINDVGTAAADELLLQMDIEGSEYLTILDMPQDVLTRFRILVVEFHQLGKLANPVFFRLYKETMDKLLADFQVVHLHPNNCCGNAKLKGIEVPRVLEITFLRKDRVADASPATEFPHPLDHRNVLALDELPLPGIWYS